MSETIFALSSGRPPAGIAVIRVSGPAAFDSALAIAGTLPPARTATLRSFRDPSTGELLDRGILIVAPAPNTATGENIVEFQCHGGKATIEAMLRCLQQLPGCRLAEAGEFTRRALINGRLDLTEAEGLGDLLAAETELQRKVALGRSEGSVRRAVERIREDLLALSAAVELAIDYADEEEGEGIRVPDQAFSAVEQAMGALLDQPPVDRLRDGVRVVVAGPPNAGKSSLVNALAREDRAIVTPIAGTTRDAIEVPLAINGIPVVLVDTAGLRDAADEVEEIGIRLAQKEITGADLVLWLGEEADAPDGALLISSKADLAPGRPGITFSAFTERGHREVLEAIAGRARDLVPSGKAIALSLREREMLSVSSGEVGQARVNRDLEIQAHFLRRALEEVDRITGRAGIEDMLDSLFSRFCVGK